MKKVGAYVRAYYENKKKQMPLNTSVQFFIDTRRLLLIEKKDMHDAEV